MFVGQSFWSLLVLAFWICLAAGEFNLGDLPECARKCVEDSVLSPGCVVFRPECICSSSSFTDAINSCVQTSCSGSDYADALKYANDHCSSSASSSAIATRSTTTTTTVPTTLKTSTTTTIPTITTPPVFTGQPLLTGSCTNLRTTSFIISNAEYIYQIKGCAGDLPECCPFVETKSGIVPMIYPANFSQPPVSLQKCPGDFSTVQTSFCCPRSGNYGLYWTNIGLHTPCYRNRTTPQETGAGNRTSSYIDVTGGLLPANTTTPPLSAPISSTQVAISYLSVFPTTVTTTAVDPSTTNPFPGQGAPTIIYAPTNIEITLSFVLGGHTKTGSNFASRGLWITIGIIIAVTAVIISGLACILIARRRRRKRKEELIIAAAAASSNASPSPQTDTAQSPVPEMSGTATQRSSLPDPGAIASRVRYGTPPPRSPNELPPSSQLDRYELPQPYLLPAPELPQMGESEQYELPPVSPVLRSELPQIGELEQPELPQMGESEQYELPPSSPVLRSELPTRFPQQASALPWPKIDMTAIRQDQPPDTLYHLPYCMQELEGHQYLPCGLCPPNPLSGYQHCDRCQSHNLQVYRHPHDY